MLKLITVSAVVGRKLFWRTIKMASESLPPWTNWIMLELFRSGERENFAADGPKMGMDRQFLSTGSTQGSCS
jgi:hypothetical protein